jgi:prepilin-type N-terminal cleavage/methylation domain-containing protein
VKKSGFTLVELLVSMPIGAVILLVLVSSFFQINEGRIEIAQRSVALNDIDQVVHRLTQDLLLAQDSNLEKGGEPVSYVTLEWSDLTHWAADIEQINHAASYYTTNSTVYRNYDGQITIVGRYISYIGFTLSDRVFTVNLTSQPKALKSAVSRIISVEMRTDDLP